MKKIFTSKFNPNTEKINWEIVNETYPGYDLDISEGYNGYDVVVTVDDLKIMIVGHPNGKWTAKASIEYNHRETPLFLRRYSKWRKEENTHIYKCRDGKFEAQFNTASRIANSILDFATPGEIGRGVNDAISEYEISVTDGEKCILYPSSSYEDTREYRSVVDKLNDELDIAIAIKNSDMEHKIQNTLDTLSDIRRTYGYGKAMLYLCCVKVTDNDIVVKIFDIINTGDRCIMTNGEICENM